MFFSRVKDAVSPYINRRNAMLVLRLYNLGVSLLVLQDYLRNADTKNPVEYFADILLHLLQATTSFDSNLMKKLALLGWNIERGAEIPLRIVTGTATIPDAIAIVDAINHSINTVGTTAAITMPDSLTSSPRPGK